MFEKVETESNEIDAETLGFVEEMMLLRTGSIMNGWLIGFNLFWAWKLFGLYELKARIELLFLFD